MKPNSITAFFPAYNDARTITGLVVAALDVLSQMTSDYEVLVVNDGSTDHTADVLEHLMQRYPSRVRIFHHARNLGYGAALRSGFALAQKEWVFYTDGDGQYDPWELIDLVAALRADVDVVNGYKTARCDPLHRVIIGRLYAQFARLVFGVRLRDVNCDFRLIRRSVLGHVELESTTGTICLELVRKLQDVGCRFVEVPVSHYHRVFGTSQFFCFGHLSRVAIHLARLWCKLCLRRFPSPGLSFRPTPAR